MNQLELASLPNFEVMVGWAREEMIKSFLHSGEYPKDGLCSGTNASLMVEINNQLKCQ